MSTMEAVNMALAYLVKNASPEAAPPKLTVVRNASMPKVAKVAKVKASKTQGECPAPHSDAPKMVPMLLEVPIAEPCKSEGATEEQITEFRKNQATTFMLAFRRAKDRNEQIQAIAGYCRYDLSADYGPQELAARGKAMSVLRPIAHKGQIAPYVRTVIPSVAGYVAGMPDVLAKQIKDLEGRILLAQDKYKLEMDLAKEAVSQSTANFHRMLACAEKTRIDYIRKDLSLLLK